MMNSQTLCFKRLKQEWSYQWRVWRMAIDWTVALYLVIPVMAALIYQYIAWWHQLPQWSNQLPRYWVFIPFVLFLFTGKIRSLIQEADQLFLRSNDEWYESLLRFGHRYSILLQGLFSMLWVALFAPFLSGLYGWKTIHLVLFGAAIWGCKFLILRKRRVDFFTEVLREREFRLRYALFFFQAGGISVTKKKKNVQTKVWFRNRKLFQSRTTINILAEIQLKRFLRSDQLVKNYIYTALVSIIAILLLPGWLKFIPWVVGTIVVYMLANSHVKQMEKSAFLHLLPTKEWDRFQAKLITIRWIMVPFLGLGTLVFLLRLI
jgi:hypothetical protein